MRNKTIKQPKKPTAAQKKIMTTKLNLNPTEWLVVSWTNTEAILQNKSDGNCVTFAIN